MDRGVGVGGGGGGRNAHCSYQCLACRMVQSRSANQGRGFANRGQWGGTWLGGKGFFLSSIMCHLGNVPHLE